MNKHNKLHNEELNDLYCSPNDLYCSPNDMYCSPNDLYCSPNDLYCSPNDLYCSPNVIWVIQSRRMGWAKHVACMVDGRDSYRVLIGRCEGRIPLGRRRHSWEDNIKMDLQEVRCDGMDRIDLARDMDRWRSFMNAVTNLRVPQNTGKFLPSC